MATEHVIKALLTLCVQDFGDCGGFGVGVDLCEGDYGERDDNLF